MDFIPNTDEQRKEMLAAIGVDSIDDLFRDIPEQAVLKDSVDIPNGISELEVKKKLTAISDKDKNDHISFLGAGCYNHFIPAIVNNLTGRSEFSTAYTPYQAEISQGSLQTLFEFQTLICQVTGMDVANASMYDGASGLAEACIMSINITKRDEIIISSSIHPDYRQVVRTYANARGFRVKEIPFDNDKGVMQVGALKEIIDKNTAAVLIQSPNFFGNVEDLEEIEKITHAKDSLLVICVVETTSLGVLKSPGDYNADIVVGEGQSLGVSMNFGGPFLGLLATKEKYLRHLPGRLVGMTKDTNGKDGFVLTLQAREQHIRRGRASSNICTSQVLVAIAATIYLSALGKNGFRNLAELNLQKAHYAYDKLCELGLKPRFKSIFYNEFVIELENIKDANERLLNKGITGGIDLGKYYETLQNCMLICVTEMHSREDIDKLVNVLKAIV
ncbi:MAG: aminomethyl-transferring glycine dehydrogenase subunit GcvPA [Candidatus Anammoxibacter sp.]